MATIARKGDKKDKKATGNSFVANGNIVLAKSKDMTPDQQEAALEHDFLTVEIHAPDGTLLATFRGDAKEFSTGSVGYGFNGKFA